MSEKNLQARMEDALDRVLREYIAADVDMRDAERYYHSKQTYAGTLEAEAQRLRMALFAIDGDYMSTAGDANIANAKRRNELKREATS